MEQRPHLVIDGALLAAGAVGAREVVLYVGADHVGAIRAMQRAASERPAAEREMLRLVSAPVRYVSGEETAAVHFVNAGIALPTSIPPRPFERGIDGRPTLVQNVETLAHAALIARSGDAWFRSLGAGGASGTTLISVGGAVPQTILIEAPQGTTITDAVNAAGGLTGATDAVLLGGYFGSWVPGVDRVGSRHRRGRSARTGLLARVWRHRRCCRPGDAAWSRPPGSSRTSRTRALASAVRAPSAFAPSPRPPGVWRRSRRRPVISITSSAGVDCSPVAARAVIPTAQPDCSDQRSASSRTSSSCTSRHHRCSVVARAVGRVVSGRCGDWQSTASSATATACARICCRR